MSGDFITIFTSPPGGDVAGASAGGAFQKTKSFPASGLPQNLLTARGQLITHTSVAGASGLIALSVSGVNGNTLIENTAAAGDRGIQWGTPGSLFLTAKGDLIAGTGAGATARFGVGADNTIIVADSSTASGLRWQGTVFLGGLNEPTTDSDVVIGNGAGSPAIFAAGTLSNVIVGSGAGAAVSTSAGLVLIGHQAGAAITTPVNSTFVGFSAGKEVKTFPGCTFIGAGSGQNFIDGIGTNGFNTAVGLNSFRRLPGAPALLANQAFGNVAVGGVALGGTAGGGAVFTVGSSNTAVGYEAGQAVTSGESNTLIGRSAGNTIAAGSFNTILGSGADVSASGASNQIAIGSGAIAGFDNSIRMGDALITLMEFGVDGGAVAGVGIGGTYATGVGGIVPTNRFRPRNVYIGNGGIGLEESADTTMGVATLAAGTATVANTSVSATSRIFLTSQTTGASPGALRISARVAGTSFTVTSTDAADTSDFAWLIITPL